MIFEFKNYRKFLESYTHGLPNKGYGFRMKMAQHLGCKSSYISQIFSGKQDLSAEQAYAMVSLLGLSPTEGRYFLLLVNQERAGTQELKEHLKKEAEELLQHSLKLKNRLSEKSLKNKEDEIKYFSTAEYAYAHILTTIPQFQGRENLIQALRVTPERFENILGYLMDLGYVIYEKGKYLPGPSRLHLPEDAAIISTHHANWRIKAMQSCQSPEANDFHYSSVISISKEDFSKIRAMLVKQIEQYKNIIKDSDCEKPVSLCFDFYHLK